MNRRELFRECWPVALGLGGVAAGSTIVLAATRAEQEALARELGDLGEQTRAANLLIADLQRSRGDLETAMSVIQDLWRVVQALQQRVGRLEAKVR